MWYFWFILWVGTGLDKGNSAVRLFIYYINGGGMFSSAQDSTIASLADGKWDPSTQRPKMTVVCWQVPPSFSWYCVLDEVSTKNGVCFWGVAVGLLFLCQSHDNFMVQVNPFLLLPNKVYFSFFSNSFLLCKAPLTLKANSSNYTQKLALPSQVLACHIL